MEDVLDLDWAPPLLSRSCELTGGDGDVLNGLRQATEGSTETDLDFLNAFPHGISPFGSAPMGLDPVQVHVTGDCAAL
jgi:hypothetical protein